MKEKILLWFKNSKILFVISFLLITILSIGFYNISFSENISELLTKPEIKILSTSNKNIYTKNNWLNNIVLFVKTTKNVDEISINSTCDITSKLILNKEWDKNNLLIYRVHFPKECNDNIITIKNEKNNLTDFARINFFDYNQTLFNYLDEKIENLKIKKENLEKENSSILEQVKKIKENTQEEQNKDSIIIKYTKLTGLYYKKEINDLNLEILDKIQKNNTDEFIIPVKWAKIPSKLNAIPWAGRPYRLDTTDGIHHWWDVFWPLGKEILASTNWVIVRIKNNFSWQDFDKLKKWELNEEDKAINLDIFRGNQVWLKTFNWDVIIYSHLSEVNNNLNVGDVIKIWTYLWKIWISWVPDKEYKNYHLHMEIQKNPKNKTNNSLSDIMKWNYWWKWMATKDILKNGVKFF